MKNHGRTFFGVGVLVGVVVMGSGAARAGDHGVDEVMKLDPELPAARRVAGFAAGLKGMWVEALARPEAGVRLKALEAIDLALGMGMEGGGDFLPGVLKLLRDEGQDGAIRLAAARVVVDLDAREAGGDLLGLDKSGGMEAALLLDGALAKWKVEGAEGMWVGRVKDSGTSEVVLKSAMRSLGAMGSVEGAAAMKGVLMDAGRDVGVRVVAAEGIAEIGGADAAEMARALIGGKRVEERILGTLVLPARKDARVEEVLVGLSTDSEAGVSAAAVGKLMGVDREALWPVVGKLAGSSDSGVRLAAAEVLRGRGEVGDVEVLAGMMGDVAPKVRGEAREALIELDGKAGLKDAVRKATMARLEEAGNWRATEQAALVLGTVGESGAKDKLLELMRAENKEVRLGAIVGLRRLKIAETLPLELARAEELAGKAKAPASGGAGPGAGAVGPGAGAVKPGAVRGRKPAVPAVRTGPEVDYVGMDRELSELNQNLGEGKYMEAAGFLGRFVGKKSGWGPEARSGAIWALGKLYEGGGNANLGRQLVGRLGDDNPTEPEEPEVKVMSAVSLGRMRDQGAKGALAKGLSEGVVIKTACEWALATLEGKAYGGPEPEVVRKSDWFVEPME